MACDVCGRRDCQRHSGAVEVETSTSCQECDSDAGIYRVAFDAVLCARCRSRRRGETHDTLLHPQQASRSAAAPGPINTSRRSGRPSRDGRTRV